MKVCRLKIWEQNISKTRKSRNKLQKSFMRIVESKKTCQVSGKGHEDKKCHTNKENQVHYTRVDDDIERSYKNYSKEKYLFNKRYFLIWIRCLTARIIGTHCLYMIQKPAVDNIPDKK